MWLADCIANVAGRRQEKLAREAGFAKAMHYEVGFGLMGVLVLTKD